MVTSSDVVGFLSLGMEANIGYCIDGALDNRSSQLTLIDVIDPLALAPGDALPQADLQGMTQQEAAVQIGLSFSGMKSRVQRARRQVKKMLLECCRVELDRRGGIADYSLHDDYPSILQALNRPCTCKRSIRCFFRAGKRQILLQQQSPLPG
jgi:hypothetical protein